MIKPIDNPIILNSHQKLYEFEEVYLSLQNRFSRLVDPKEDLTIPIFSKVKLTKPKNLSVYNGSLAILKLSLFPKTGPRGINNQGDKATMNGTLFIFYPGDSDKSAQMCMRYTDIVGAYLKDKLILADEFPGTQVFKPDGPVHDTKVVVVDPKNPNNPTKSTASMTNFVVSKPPQSG